MAQGMGEEGDTALDLDAAVDSAMRHTRPRVRGVALPWEHGYFGFVLGNRQLADPLADPMRFSRVPELPSGNEPPRLRDEVPQRRAREHPLVVAQASDASASVAKKQKIIEYGNVCVQRFEDAELDQALRSWRAIVCEMSDSSGSLLTDFVLSDGCHC